MYLKHSCFGNCTCFSLQEITHQSLLAHMFLWHLLQLHPDPHSTLHCSGYCAGLKMATKASENNKTIWVWFHMWRKHLSILRLETWTLLAAVLKPVWEWNHVEGVYCRNRETSFWWYSLKSGLSPDLRFWTNELHDLEFSLFLLKSVWAEFLLFVKQPILRDILI